MARYAADTEVTSDRSRAEIERTLRRYNASSFAYGWEESQAVVMFSIEGYRVRFILPMPSKNERRFTHTETGRLRSDDVAYREWEQGCRQAWRALSLVIKAKLEAVEAGIVTLVEEFGMHMLLPGGQSVGTIVTQSIEKSYKEGAPPSMLSAAFGMPELTDGSGK